MSWLNKEQFATSLSLYFTLIFLKTALGTKQALIDLNQHDFILFPSLLVTTLALNFTGFENCIVTLIE